MQSRIIYSTTKALTHGAIAGVIAAIVMGAIAYAVPVNASGVQEPFFVVVTGQTGPIGTVLGWALNILAGILIGAVFGLLTTKISKIRANSFIRSLGLGVIAGVIVWVALFIPVSLSVKALSASSSFAAIAASALGLHVIFGVILGIIGGTLHLRSKTYRCEECGAVFSSREAVMEHSRVHLKSESRYKCVTCGAIFNTEAEMTEHAKMHMRVEQVFKCDACGMSFGTQQELLEHAKTHVTTEQIYRCKICGGQFKGQQELLEHSKMHIKD
ncbi:MAG: C2H2-type zinc finger protein [Nitrososphaerales archaeon]